MAHLLYNNNLSNNIGVVHEIIDQAENERFMSSILLYCALLHEDTVARGRPDFAGYSIGNSINKDHFDSLPFNIRKK